MSNGTFLAQEQNRLELNLTLSIGMSVSKGVQVVLGDALVELVAFLFSYTLL